MANNWTAQEEKQVSKLTRYQIGQMTLKQLYIAVEYEKFSVEDLVAQAREVATGDELEAVLEHIARYEDETNKTGGSWYQATLTIKR